MLPMLASIVSFLIANKLPGVANAVIDKGVDYVSDKLGIELKPDMTPEEMQKVAEAAMKHEEFLITEANDNTDSARDMNLGIQESANASTLAKNSAYILDFVIVIATLALSALTFFAEIPEENKELVYLALGSLITMTGTVINFHRGSSSGSKDNGAAIRNVLTQKGRE